MLAPLKKKFHLGDDDGAQLLAPKRFPAVALPVVDEEFAFPVEEDEDRRQIVSLKALPSASHVDIDEEFAFPLEEDEDNRQIVSLKALPSASRTDVDEEFAFPLEEDEDHRQVASLRLVPAPAHVDIDEEFAFPLEDDSEGITPTVGQTRTGKLPDVDEEAAFPLEEDEDNRQAANLRQPPTSSRADVDEDFVVPAEEDEDHRQPAALRLVPAPGRTDVDDDYAFPTEEDEDHRQPVSLRLIPALIPQVDPEEALAPILDDDAQAPHTVRPLRIVALRHDSDSDDFPTPPPPPPQPEPSGGDSWRYRLRRYLRQVRDEDIDQILTEYDLADEDLEYALPGIDFVGVATTSLNVSVCATFLPVEVVERGNLVHFVATFEGDPDEVHFSYTRPQETRPVVDPGFDQPGSEIARVAPGVYAFSIDTTRFSGGKIEWHFWGVGRNQKSQFGEFVVRNRPPQLL